VSKDDIEKRVDESFPDLIVHKMNFGSEAEERAKEFFGGLKTEKKEKRVGDQTRIDEETGEILTEEEFLANRTLTKIKGGEFSLKDRSLGELYDMTVTVRVIGTGEELDEKTGFRYKVQKIKVVGINQEF
jgi:hypothetical protein